MLQRVLSTLLGVLFLIAVFVFTSILVAVALTTGLLLAAWVWWRSRGREPRSASPMSAFLSLTVNGEPRRTSAATIAALVAELGFRPEKVAVERNGEIVPRSAHAGTLLADGDKLEIVVAVGGG